MAVYKKHFIIPDTQIKPGIDLKFLKRIGMYVDEHASKDDEIIMLGDFADMESLSSYDKGKKSFEGRRYRNDIDAAKRGQSFLLAGLGNCKARRTLLIGNHEERINKAVESQPELDGVIGIGDLSYLDYGWRVVDFLVPVSLDGVVYAHYFISGNMGRPTSSAQRLISTKHQSCIAGHQQGRQVAYGTRADGRRLTAMIIGSCYEHNESYMGPQGNKHWRGIAVLNEVKDGEFDEMFVSLDYLKRRYK